MTTSEIRGFNYNPSYCTTLFEAWDGFCKEIWRTEIGRGKDYFPGLNCLRIWLDYQPYLRDPNRFVANFGAVLDMCGEMGIDVMPTIFNRWHDFTYDFGGVYYDYLINSRYAVFDDVMFKDYIRDVITPFADDERIVMWDLCNEPEAIDLSIPNSKAEFDWLEWTAGRVRDLGTKQPITIGSTCGANVEIFEPLCDIICIHPYPGWWDDGFEIACDWAVNLGKIKGKPVVANETCQGSLDDAVRAEIIRNTLGALKARGIGWCAWQLHGGRMVSGNRVHMDRNCRPGDRAYMAFINPDGSLRPGSEAFNEF